MLMTQPMLPYGKQCIEAEDRLAVEAVLRSDWLTQGPTVQRFEEALAEYCGARYAVAVTSGTAALHLAALAAGIQPSQRVITSPNTFVASANCVIYAGGRPQLADIEPRTLNLDPMAVGQALSGAEADAVCGILPVHFAGCPADMEALSRLARARGMFVIEDACHALGARWRDRAGAWHRVGDCSHSDMAVFSFHPVKHMTTGEGGAVLTQSAELAERLRELRTHGITRDPSRMMRNDGGWYYEMQSLGFNYRITDIQCALGVAQLKRMDRWIARRSELVAEYRELLRRRADVTLTDAPANVAPAWHLFTVQVPRRRQVYDALRAAGIGVQVHYIPVHHQPYYQRELGVKAGDFPNCERYYARALSLPLFPAMTSADVQRVVHSLECALASTALQPAG